MRFLSNVRTLSFALLASSASPIVDKPNDSERIVWQKDVESALTQAREQKKIVFLAVNMDGERACDRLADKVYGDKSLAALASQSLNLIASPNEHVGGDKPCPRFGSLRCAEHQKIDMWARKNALKPDAGGYVIAPQHVFLDPQGKVILSVPYEVSAAELEWCWITALHTLDPQSKAAPASGTRAPRRLILGGVWDPASTPSGTPATRSEALGLIKEMKKGLESDRRIEMLRRVLSSDEPECIDYVRSELRSGGTAGSGGNGGAYGDQRARVLRSIGALSPPSYWELVSEFAVGGQNDLRLEAAVALEQLAAPASLKRVQTAFAKEDHREIKKEWIRALAAVGSSDAATRKEILKLAQTEKDELLRLNAIVALGSLAPGDDVTTVLKTVLEKGASSERAAAACALALTRDPQWLSVLESNSGAEPDANVSKARSAAARSLRSGGLLAIREVLAQVAQDKLERERWFGSR